MRDRFGHPGSRKCALSRAVEVKILSPSMTSSFHLDAPIVSPYPHHADARAPLEQNPKVKYATHT